MISLRLQDKEALALAGAGIFIWICSIIGMAAPVVNVPDGAPDEFPTTLFDQEDIGAAQFFAVIAFLASMTGMCVSGALAINGLPKIIKGSRSQRYILAAVNIGCWALATLSALIAFASVAGNVGDTLDKNNSTWGVGFIFWILVFIGTLVQSLVAVHYFLPPPRCAGFDEADMAQQAETPKTQISCPPV